MRFTRKKIIIAGLGAAGLVGLVAAGAALADAAASDQAPPPPPPVPYTEAAPRRDQAADPRATVQGPQPYRVAGDYPHHDPRHVPPHLRGDDDRRGPPHGERSPKGDRKGDDRRVAGAGEWVWCHYERDGDLDCDEDDHRDRASHVRASAPPPPPPAR